MAGNYYEIIVPVSTSGANGSANGTVETLQGVYGKLHAVHVDYDASAPNTTTVDVDEVGGAGRKLLDLSGGNTDATYYPTAPVQNNTGAPLTFDSTEPLAQPFVLAGRKLKFTVGNSNALTPAAKITLIMEA